MKNKQKFTRPGKHTPSSIATSTLAWNVCFSGLFFKWLSGEYHINRKLLDGVEKAVEDS